jgi:hypothetical protein
MLDQGTVNTRINLSAPAGYLVSQYLACIGTPGRVTICELLTVGGRQLDAVASLQTNDQS